jgi:hypothetical protein
LLGTECPQFTSDIGQSQVYLLNFGQEFRHELKPVDRLVQITIMR